MFTKSNNLDEAQNKSQIVGDDSTNCKFAEMYSLFNSRYLDNNEGLVTTKATKNLSFIEMLNNTTSSPYSFSTKTT